MEVDEQGNFVTGGGYSEVAAIVVTYNSASDVSSLIDELRMAAKRHAIRVIVVDNQSSDDTVTVVRAHDDITLVETGGNLGYAGGINRGMSFIGKCGNVLILNPDLSIDADAIANLLVVAAGDRIGAVVPRMLGQGGVMRPFLFREPTLTRAIGDALLGSVFRRRPRFSSAVELRRERYSEAHDVDWATGAAVMIPVAIARAVGDWDEDFFLYSEETDYFRRIRMSGYRVRYEPAAAVRHRGAGSGTSPALATLKAVNRVRYVERYHGRVYSAMFRAVVALAEGLRSYDPVHRRSFVALLLRRRWLALPKATKPAPPIEISGSRLRGAVIIPACNESALINRTLEPLSNAAVERFIELIVVCNGCTDQTAELARGVPGAQVVELAHGSKPAALNAGDRAATLWPRLYLDADVQISIIAVLAVLDRLARGDVMVACPDSRYDSRGASALVRSYYRARSRITLHNSAMWRAGAYGLSEQGHSRFDAFPTVTNDDLFVDSRFEAHEKAVVSTEQSVRDTPTDAENLLRILCRHRRGGAELVALELERSLDPRVGDTGRDTATAIVSTIRGPQSAFDAAVFLGMALAARWRSRTSSGMWERDESTRQSK